MQASGALILLGQWCAAPSRVLANLVNVYLKSEDQVAQVFLPRTHGLSASLIQTKFRVRNGEYLSNTTAGVLIIRPPTLTE